MRIRNTAIVIEEVECSRERINSDLYVIEKKKEGVENGR